VITMTSVTATVDEHQVARLLAASRLAVGGLLLAAPGFAVRRWLGTEEAGPDVKVLARAAGAREVALAVGALRALGDGSDARPWVAGAAAADAVDALAAIVALGRHQPVRALLSATVAGVAAATGATVARRLGDSA
jgi:hypothetical protein